MLRPLSYITALVIVLASGFAQRVWTGAWTVSHELEAAVARIDYIPQTFGDWESEPEELDQAQLEQGEVAGYMARRYRNTITGEEFLVLLVCGRPGPISVHPPDVCYGGAGYNPMTPPEVDQIAADAPESPHQFLAARFARLRSAIPESLDIFWAWNAEGPWEAPRNPRLHFAPHRALYKLYVIRRATSADEQREHAICRDFLRELIPVLDSALFARTPS